MTDAGRRDLDAELSNLEVEHGTVASPAGLSPHETSCKAFHQ